MKRQQGAAFALVGQWSFEKLCRRTAGKFRSALHTDEGEKCSMLSCVLGLNVQHMSVSVTVARADKDDEQPAGNIQHTDNTRAAGRSMALLQSSVLVSLCFV